MPCQIKMEQNDNINNSEAKNSIFRFIPSDLIPLSTI